MQNNIDISKQQWPILYRDEYNVNFFGLEKLHPFDAKKWKHIFKHLEKNGLITKETVVKPNEIKQEDLLVVHTKKYLKTLKRSYKVAFITEIIFMSLVPNYFVQKAYLRPMRFQTGGSVLAGKIAMERGWAINIGGGFHHCSADKGGGFCAYADITLLVQHLFMNYSGIQKIMIVDLDAHQGNGHENDFKHNDKVYIMDVFNKHIYPKDKEAKESIRKKVELDFLVEDNQYIKKVTRALTEALDEFHPDFLVFNAGTDVLDGDPLGRLAISPDGVIKRDQVVFTKAGERNIPIVMLTSGGYQDKSARTIAQSIINLYNKRLIKGPCDI